MKKILQYIYAKLINYLQGDNSYLYINIKSIVKLIENDRIKECLKDVSIGENSRFYSEAKVFNLQKNKTKITIGKNSHIRGNLQIFQQNGRISIGDFFYLGENSYIWSALDITIGNNVLIAHNVNIHDNISHPLNSKLRHDDYKRILGIEKADCNNFDLRSKKIIIKDNAWIGFNCIILKGVTIGEGAVVAAGSVITKDVPDFAVVAGNPAQLIKHTI